MDHYILNAVRDTCQNKVAGSELDSISLTQLLQLKVILGVARNEGYAGRRHLDNQNSTGTVSCLVLKDILKRRSECLWTCSMCV